jgi:hypothetical protein
MIEQGAFDAWGLRTPPAWAQRALEKGIIDESRFHALIRVASADASSPGQLLVPAPADPLLHPLAGLTEVVRRPGRPANAAWRFRAQAPVSRGPGVGSATPWVGRRFL